jgi:hypothetical protein
VGRSGLENAAALVDDGVMEADIPFVVDAQTGAVWGPSPLNPALDKLAYLQALEALQLDLVRAFTPPGGWAQ